MIFEGPLFRMSRRRLREGETIRVLAIAINYADPAGFPSDIQTLPFRPQKDMKMESHFYGPPACLSVNHLNMLYRVTIQDLTWVNMIIMCVVQVHYAVSQTTCVTILYYYVMWHLFLCCLPKLCTFAHSIGSLSSMVMSVARKVDWDRNSSLFFGRAV